MNKLKSYLGLEPFTVLIDDSSQLRKLSEKAKKLRDLPFHEKLEAVKELSVNSMINAYEEFMRNSNPEEKERNKEIVFGAHPLSYALEQGAGCCRYQGALFFVLGYDAELGDKHFIQAAPVNANINSVFNEIVMNNDSYKVSIFRESLKDKSLDYSIENPKIFEQAFKELVGYNFYSYHRTLEGLVLISNKNKHIMELKD